MNDALTMSLIESLRDFCADLQNLIEGQRAFFQACGKSLALDVLHHHEVGAVLCANVVQSADVGVLQRRNGSGFAFQALF